MHILGPGFLIVVALYQVRSAVRFITEVRTVDMTTLRT